MDVIKKIGVIKPYLQAPLKELYDNAIKSTHLGFWDEAIDSDVNVNISDYTSHEILTPQVKIMSKKRRDMQHYKLL